MPGSDGDFTHTSGYERILENWYIRAIGHPYSVPFFNSDFSTLVQDHPGILAFGANTGTVNSFAGLDLGSLTVSLSFYFVIAFTSDNAFHGSIDILVFLRS